MFGLGLWEIVVIAVAALVLVRPQDLPKILRRIGRGYGHLLRLREQVMRTARDLESEIRRYGEERGDGEESGGERRGGPHGGSAGRGGAESGELRDEAAGLYRRLHEDEIE